MNNKYELSELELINLKTEAYARASTMTNDIKVLEYFYNLFLDKLIIKRSIENLRNGLK